MANIKLENQWLLENEFHKLSLEIYWKLCSAYSQKIIVNSRMSDAKLKIGNNQCLLKLIIMSLVSQIVTLGSNFCV